jgi:hypothetical protein
MQYIGLGSNCSVTHWLNKLGLRSQALPFDWSSLTIRQLNSVLGANFANYADSLELKFISDKFPGPDNEPSALITNSYGVKFAHEVLSTNIQDFKSSVENRIIRFIILNKETPIIYVRIELQIVKNNYVLELKKLIELLDLINPNYVIKLIVHSSSIKIDLDKVQIHHFDSFSPDWKMSHLDWEKILF